MVTEAGGDPRGTDTRSSTCRRGSPARRGRSLTPPQLNEKGDVVLLSAVPRTAPASDDTAALVVHVRDDVLPRPTPARASESHVGGYTASYVDLASLISARLLLVIGTVILPRLRAADDRLPFAARPAPGRSPTCCPRLRPRGAHRRVPVGLGHLAARHRHGRRLGADRQLRPADDVHGALRSSRWTTRCSSSATQQHHHAGESPPRRCARRSGRAPGSPRPPR